MRLTYTLPVVSLHKINVLSPLNTRQAFNLHSSVHESLYGSGSQTFYTKYHLRKYLAFQVPPL